MVICVICGINSICTECIDFNFENEDIDKMQFECPACFVKKENAGRYVCEIKHANIKHIEQ